MVNKPQDIGLLPDNATTDHTGTDNQAQQQQQQAAVKSSSRSHTSTNESSTINRDTMTHASVADEAERGLPEEEGVTVREALRSPAFYALAFCNVEASLVQTAAMYVGPA